MSSGNKGSTLPPSGLAEDVLGQNEEILAFADHLESKNEAKKVVEPTIEYHLVTFVLENEQYGVPIRQVREIIRVGEITRVPGAPIGSVTVARTPGDPRRPK